MPLIQHHLHLVSLRRPLARRQRPSVEAATTMRRLLQSETRAQRLLPLRTHLQNTLGLPTQAPAISIGSILGVHRVPAHTLTRLHALTAIRRCRMMRGRHATSTVLPSRRVTFRASLLPLQSLVGTTHLPYRLSFSPLLISVTWPSHEGTDKPSPDLMPSIGPRQSTRSWLAS